MARPGPKPSGRVNEVKVMLDDEAFQDLMMFKAVHGIGSNSKALGRAWVLFSRGAMGGIMPGISAALNQSPANSGRQ
jgi:hypothetical protein